MDIEILKQRAKAFDYLFDAVVVTDLEGIIIDWNKGSEALYGYAKAEAIGQPVNMLHVPEDIESITAEVIAAVQKEGKWTGEIRMLHKDGQVGWIESMCVPIYDANKQMLGALGINRDISARKKEAQRLEHLAHYDQLTHVPNRYLLLDRLQHLIAQSVRDQNTFAVCFVDVDKFKLLNDSKGHLFGDQVLKEVAARLVKTVRNSDTVARFGGDEFVLLLENIANKKDVTVMVDLLSQALHTGFMINGENFEINCSIGAATFPNQGTTADTLIATADKAMYKAKQSLSVKG